MKTLNHYSTANAVKSLLVLLLTFSSLAIDAQVFDWAKQFGGVLYDQAEVLATDAAGNIYVGGIYRGTGDFDPGPGTYNMTAMGFADIYIVKLTASGSFVWAKSVGGAGDPGGPVFQQDDGINSIVVAPSGSIYVSGSFTGTVDFDPGSGVYNMVSMPNPDSGCYNMTDGFILKLNGSGDFVWAKQIGGSGADACQIALGPQESLLVSGSYESVSCSTDPVDLDPGAGTYYVPGGGGAYVENLDSSGNLFWANVFPGWTGCTSPCGGKDLDIVISNVVLDRDGNIYCGGRFYHNADFDPGAATYFMTPVAAFEAFVLKLTGNGGFVWAKQLSGGTYSEERGIDVDTAGNVFTTGFFRGTADFDPGNRQKNLTSFGNSDDIYVWKLKSTGDYSWAGQMGSTANDWGTGIDVGIDGSVYTTGLFRGSADFDPGKKSSLLQSAGNMDVFVSKLDNNGGFVWAGQMGGSADDYGSAILVDTSNSIYTVGTFGLTADFDAGSATYNMTAYDMPDGFVQKMSQSGGTSGGGSGSGGGGGGHGGGGGGHGHSSAKWGGNETSGTNGKADFILFPNPTQDLVTLSFQRDLEDAAIRVFNSAGQLVMQQVNVSGYTYSVNLSDQPSGLYIVEVGNADKVTHLKVLKQ